MRKMFLLREVVEIGRALGMKTHKGSIYWWTTRGHFAEPVAKLPHATWYLREDIVRGYLAVGEHYGWKFGEKEIRRAIDLVLERNKEVTKQMFNFEDVLCDEKKE